MISKLICLLMQWDTFNEFSVLERVRGVVRAIKHLQLNFLQKQLATLI